MVSTIFQTILTSFRKYSFSERDKGDKFERLMQAYLQTDPKYAFQFSNVWLWNDFPARKDFGGKDIGIDLIAKTVNGDYWAIHSFGNQIDANVFSAEVFTGRKVIPEPDV